MGTKSEENRNAPSEHEEFDTYFSSDKVKIPEDDTVSGVRNAARARFSPFSPADQVQLPEVVGLHRAGILDVHRLLGPGQHRERPAVWNCCPVQAAVGAAGLHGPRVGGTDAVVEIRYTICVVTRSRR